MFGDNAIEQIKEICFLHDLTLYVKGNTLYALTKEQVAALPQRDFIYRLIYLRAAEKEEIENLINIVKGSMSPSGKVYFEPKTSSLILRDNENAIESAKNMLVALDKSKGQVSVVVRVLRVNTEVSKGLGLDWSKTLGSNEGEGLNIGATAVGSLGKITASAPIFGDAVAALNAITGSSLQTKHDRYDFGHNFGGWVEWCVANGDRLWRWDSSKPITLSVVLRALNQSNLVTTERTPRFLTEDNSTFTLNQREFVPFIQNEFNQSVGASNPTVTSKAVYDIPMQQDDQGENGDSTLKRQLGFRIEAKATIIPNKGLIRIVTNPQIGRCYEILVWC